MEMWGYRFEPVEASVSEELPPGTEASSGVRILAERKALAGLDKWLKAGGSREAVVLGSDTMVVLDGQALGKPRNAEEAFSMLERLSGREHLVLSGVALVRTGKLESFVVETKVRFRQLTVREIKDYIASGEPMDKAGAYGIQGQAQAFVAAYEGSLTNVIGLPMEQVAERLAAWGIRQEVIAPREVVHGLPEIEGSSRGNVSP